MTCEDALESAAVALLTRDPIEPAVQAHLDSCASCRDELARLAPLPGLLSTVDAADLVVPEPAGGPMLDRLLSAASRERRRSRTQVLAVAAAVVAMLAVPAGIWGVQQLRSPTPKSVVAVTPIAFTWSGRDGATGVWAKAEVSKTAWGSDLDVSISGVASGTRCTIVVVTKDGRSQTAATWQASYTGTAQVRGTVAAPTSSIARIDIVDDSGRVLVRI